LPVSDRTRGDPTSTWATPASPISLDVDIGRGAASRWIEVAPERAATSIGAGRRRMACRPASIPASGSWPAARTTCTPRCCQRLDATTARAVNACRPFFLLPHPYCQWHGYRRAALTARANVAPGSGASVRNEDASAAGPPPAGNGPCPVQHPQAKPRLADSDARGAIVQAQPRVPGASPLLSSTSVARPTQRDPSGGQELRDRRSDTPNMAAQHCCQATVISRRLLGRATARRSRHGRPAAAVQHVRQDAGLRRPPSGSSAAPPAAARRRGPWLCQRAVGGTPLRPSSHCTPLTPSAEHRSRAMPPARPPMPRPHPSRAGPAVTGARAASFHLSSSSLTVSRACVPPDRHVLLF